MLSVSLFQPRRTRRQGQVWTEDRGQVWALKGSVYCLSQKREARAEPGALGRALERGAARDSGGHGPALPWVPSWVSDPELARRRHRGTWMLPSGAGGNRAPTRRRCPSPSCLPRELLGGPQAWPLLLASCLVPGALQLASLPLLPESPRYLLIDCGDPAACRAGEPLAWAPRPRFPWGTSGQSVQVVRLT